MHPACNADSVNGNDNEEEGQIKVPVLAIEKV
jgi:hypothetical protein